jgi:hypothetical protein
VQRRTLMAIVAAGVVAGLVAGITVLVAPGIGSGLGINRSEWARIDPGSRCLITGDGGDDLVYGIGGGEFRDARDTIAIVVKDEFEPSGSGTRPVLVRLQWGVEHSVLRRNLIPLH